MFDILYITGRSQRNHHELRNTQKHYFLSTFTYVVAWQRISGRHSCWGEVIPGVMATDSCYARTRNIRLRNSQDFQLHQEKHLQR